MCTRFILISVLCLAPLNAPAGELRYVGSSTVGRFMADAAGVYDASSFDIHVKPESLGGERCPRLGTCDLGGVARPLSESERNNGVVGTLIGHDAIAVVVHPDNPVHGLSSAQIQGVFTGKIRNWAEIGGLDMPITPHIVDWNSATRQVFQQTLLGGNPYAGCEVAVPDSRVMHEVARDVGAVGHISRSFLVNRADVRPLQIDGQAPEAGNPFYPAMRPLYLATRGPPRGEAGAFIRWVLSEEGQLVVRGRFEGVP